MGFDFGGEFDRNNGTNGKIPVTRREWVRVGLDSDIKAYNLLNYLHRRCIRTEILKNSCFRTVWTLSSRP
jgi:hypothetical protein